jgi:hypothetical protein
VSPGDCSSKTKEISKKEEFQQTDEGGPDSTSRTKRGKRSNKSTETSRKPNEEDQSINRPITIKSEPDMFPVVASHPKSSSVFSSTLQEKIHDVTMSLRVSKTTNIYDIYHADLSTEIWVSVTQKLGNSNNLMVTDKDM